MHIRGVWFIGNAILHRQNGKRRTDTMFVALVLNTGASFYEAPVWKSSTGKIMSVFFLSFFFCGLFSLQRPCIYILRLISQVPVLRRVPLDLAGNVALLACSVANEWNFCCAALALREIKGHCICRAHF